MNCEVELILSIRSLWCRHIANRIKEVEIRKHKPKAQPPFKCYIYNTKAKFNTKNNFVYPEILRKKIQRAIEPWYSNEEQYLVYPESYWENTAYKCNGKVIGEFICDKIIEYEAELTNDYNLYNSISEITWDEETQDEIQTVVLSNECDDIHKSKFFIDTHLTLDDIRKYLFNGTDGFYKFYGLHISELIIYEKPKDIKEFGLTQAPQSWCYIR